MKKLVLMAKRNGARKPPEILPRYFRLLRRFPATLNCQQESLPSAYRFCHRYRRFQLKFYLPEVPDESYHRLVLKELFFSGRTIPAFEHYKRPEYQG